MITKVIDKDQLLLMFLENKIDTTNFLDLVYDKLTIDALDLYFSKFKKYTMIFDIAIVRQKLSTDLLNKYCIYFSNECWKSLAKYQKLSDEFMLLHLDKLSLCIIMCYQKLSINFIKKIENIIFDNKEAIFYLTKYQKLNEEIILKHADKFDKFLIKHYQYNNLSKEFQESYFQEDSYEVH